MSNQTAIIASAIIAGCVSIISVTSIPATPAQAADECLASPKATTPAGGHWYYRIEKGTKRKCWYLGDAGARVNKTVAAKPVADEQDASETAADTAAPAPQKPLRKSVANARAELTTSVPDEDAALAGSTWPPLNEPAPNATTGSDNRSAAEQPRPSITDPSSTQSWTMASRWPVPNASSDERAVAPPQEPARQPPVLTAERLVTAAANTGPATAEPATTAAQQPQAEPDSLSLGLLLSVLAGVLALAAIIGPLIFKYAKPHARREIAPAGRRPIWDTPTQHQSPPLFVQDEIRRRPVVLDDDIDQQPIHVTGEADAAADEIEELLARASRRSAA